MLGRRQALRAGGAILGTALAGCGLSDGGDRGKRGLTSPAFEEGDSIPTRYTCDGEGVSPPLSIAGVPDDAESIALVMDDPDANGYTHWLLWNVPPDTTEVPANLPAAERVAALDGALQGTNDAGQLGYGPCCPPPDDGPHTYRFRRYAVASVLDLEPGARKGALLDAIDAAGGEWVDLTVRYDR